MFKNFFHFLFKLQIMEMFVNFRTLIKVECFPISTISPLLIIAILSASITVDNHIAIINAVFFDINLSKES